MIFHHHSLMQGGARPAYRFACTLALALTPALIPAARALTAPTHAQGAQPHLTIQLTEPAPDRPYLTAVGVCPLRFAPPPPERSAEMPVFPKPLPKVIPHEETPPPPPPAVTPPPAPVVAPPEPPQPPLDPNAAKPLGIIPDDTKREVHAEDVLPFFQFPDAPSRNTSGTFTPAQPAQPGTLPPSSATYQQK